MTQTEMTAEWDHIAATSSQYYAAYYRRRRDEASQSAADCEQSGDANGVNHYKMKAHDYEEAAKAVER